MYVMLFIKQQNKSVLFLLFSVLTLERVFGFHGSASCVPKSTQVIGNVGVIDTHGNNGKGLSLLGRTDQQRSITRQAVTVASSLADFNNNRNRIRLNENQTAPSLLGTVLPNGVVSEQDGLDDAVQAEIDQKQKWVQQRLKRPSKSIYRASLPLSSRGTGEPIGMAICQVDKGRSVLNKVLDFDNLEIEADETPLNSSLQGNLDLQFKGLIVCYVAEHGQAWKAGVRTGDCLLSVSATIGGALWPKTTLEGVQSAIMSRKALSSKGGSVLMDLARLDSKESSTINNQFELTLTRPIGLILQETSDGFVQVTGFTKNAPNLIKLAVQIGDCVVAVDSSLGDRMWPVSTVDGVISACTARLPGQSIKMRFERPEANMLGASTLSDSSVNVQTLLPKTKASAASSVAQVATSVVDQKELKSRCRDVLRRYATEDSYGSSTQTSVFKGKYALSAIVADKVVDALASASATLDTVTLNMIMKAYISCQSPKKAMRVFEAATGFNADGSSNPPVSIIKGVGGKALVPNESALNLFTGTTLLQAHALNRDLASVKRVLAALEGNSGETINGLDSAPWPWTGVYGSLQVDTQMLNAAIAAAEKIGGDEAVQTALDIFNRMADDHFSSKSTLSKVPTRDIITYNTIISILGNAGRSAEAFDFFEKLNRVGIRPDKYTYTALIKACEKVGDIDEILYDMRERGVQADVITYNTMIKYLCERGKWTQATRLIFDMESRGISPNSMTYGHLMNAMLQAGKPNACLALFESAISSSRTSMYTENVHIYTSAITAASKLKDHERALELVMRMNAKGIKPNMKTLTAVMGACLASNEYGFAAQLFKRISDPDGYAVAQGIRALCGNNEVTVAADLLKTHASVKSTGMTGKDTMRSYATVFQSSLDNNNYNIARSIISDLLAKGFLPSKSMLSYVLKMLQSEDGATLNDFDEKLFSLCLFLVDSLRNRKVSIDGSLYAATLLLGKRLGGTSLHIAALLAQTKSAADTVTKKLVFVPSTNDEEQGGIVDETNQFTGWEEFKRQIDSLTDDNNTNWRKLSASLPFTPVRLSTKEMRYVLRAEQAVAVGLQNE